MFIEEKEQIDDQIRRLNRDTIKLWDDHLEENYTVNFVLNKPEWEREYRKLMHEFEIADGGLYLYPLERLHMTLLGRIERSLPAKKVVEVVRKNMQGKKYPFKVGYLACNELSVSIVSEPEFDLEGLRNQVRTDLGLKGDDYTKYLRIYERLAWVNLLRFKKTPGEKFFEALWKMRNYQLGEFEAKDIDIYLNSSRTMDPTKCRLVEKIVF